jgi:hypothetical protein
VELGRAQSASKWFGPPPGGNGSSETLNLDRL